MAMTTTTPWGRPFGIGPVEVVSNYNPGSTPTTYTVNVAAYVPVGTKAVQISVSNTSVTGGPGGTVAVRKYSSSSDVARETHVSMTDIALTCWIELDSSYRFDLWFDNAVANAVDVILSAGAIP